MTPASPRLHPRIAAALARFDREQIGAELPTELPLLERMRRAFPSAGRFADCDVFFVQHHLGPLVPRVWAMAEDGLDLRRSWFVDIPYSTCSLVREALVGMGCPREQMAAPFDDPLAPYGPAQQARVTELLRAMAARPDPRPLLVVDDGAYVVRSLRRALLEEPSLALAFEGSAVVEQTTRGHRYLHGDGRELVDELGLRVVSIARCDTKVAFEGPFIGAAVSRALTRALGARLAEARRVAVIGYGTVGEACVDRLLQGSDVDCVDVVDSDPTARRRASRRLRSRGLAELCPSGAYELVLGCTGYASFRLDQRHLLAREAVLASGSSAAVEFNRAGFVELADERDDDEIEVLHRDETRRAGIHATIEIAHEGGKRVHILNAGFPVNFDGQIECLPIGAIQATHALLFAAAEQALSRAPPGLTRIDAQRDGWIFDNAVDLLA